MLEKLSKDDLKKYILKKKNKKLFSPTQDGIYLVHANLDKMCIQPILKHLQYSSSAAFLIIIFESSIIFTIRRIF